MSKGKERVISKTNTIGDIIQLLTKNTSAMIIQETSSIRMTNMIGRGNLVMIKIIPTEGTDMIQETMVITKGFLTVIDMVVNM